MMKKTRLKSAALFMAIVGAGAWSASSLVAGTMASDAPKMEASSAKVEKSYHTVPGMVVTYTDGYAGGTIDDGKGTTSYKEPYDASFFVTTVSNGKPERTNGGDYYGWTIDVPKTCAAKAKAAVGRSLMISIRTGDEDPHVNELDLNVVRNAVCLK